VCATAGLSSIDAFTRQSSVATSIGTSTTKEGDTVTYFDLDADRSVLAGRSADSADDLDVPLAGSVRLDGGGATLSSGALGLCPRAEKSSRVERTFASAAGAVAESRLNDASASASVLACGAMRCLRRKDRACSRYSLFPANGAKDGNDGTTAEARFSKLCG